eukprot:3507195-Amphidinium_carterae.2
MTARAQGEAAVAQNELHSRLEDTQTSDSRLTSPMSSHALSSCMLAKGHHALRGMVFCCGRTVSPYVAARSMNDVRRIYTWERLALTTEHYNPLRVFSRTSVRNGARMNQST